MLKVFLVEDESVVREGLRDNIPWEQYGFRFVGEAGDGEMALPLIRKTRPDVLITDIKMPFMDGLSLCHIVGQEFPETKMIIISGYDDFEYARQAIRVGVEQYLSKPVTRSAMQKALAEVREKIEGEKEQQNYMKKFQSEMREYERFFRRDFFEKVFEGQLSVQEIYEEAQKLSLDINAPCYNLVMISIQEKKKNGADRVKLAGVCQKCEEDLMRYCLRFSEYLVFRWSIDTYGILVKGDEQSVLDYTRRLVDQIETICVPEEENLEWYAAAGKPVERFSLLEECYNQVNHIFSYRFLEPKQHILMENMMEEYLQESREGQIGQFDISKVNPDIIKGFLAGGRMEEVGEFTASYLESLKEPLKSKLFRDYLVLNIRFTVLAYAESIGVSQQEFLKDLEPEGTANMTVSYGGMEEYMKKFLQKALKCRSSADNSKGTRILNKALEYIEEHYTSEQLSLNEVAGITEVSANYFSAMFSQKMDMSFTEYVTEKRMEKAKELLRTTRMRSAEIAPAVGYKDAHYFSFVFKKTQGMTPKEYRYGEHH